MNCYTNNLNDTTVKGVLTLSTPALTTLSIYRQTPIDTSTHPATLERLLYPTDTDTKFIHSFIPFLQT